MKKMVIALDSKRAIEPMSLMKHGLGSAMRLLTAWNPV